MFNKIIATAAVVMLTAAAAQASPGNDGCVGNCADRGGNVSLDLNNRQEVVNNLIASGGYSRAEAEAVAEAYAKQSQGQSQSSVNVASGGDARATGGDASAYAHTGNNTNVNAVGQNTNVGGQRTSVGGQSSNQSVVVEGDRNPVASAIAPSLNIQHGGCDFSVGLSAAYQSYGQGVSGGGGLFWVRKETCYKVMIADRYLAMGHEQEAVRILREVEASFE